MTIDRDELRRKASALSALHVEVIPTAGSRASVREVTNAVPVLLDEFAEAEAKVARLRGALEPFAHYVIYHDDLDAHTGTALSLDSKSVDYHQRGCPTYGDCRNAAKVLEETK